MKFVFVVFFAHFCFVLSKPVQEAHELEEVDDAAVIADATKFEKLSPHHNFKLKHVKHHKEEDKSLEPNVKDETRKETPNDDIPGLVEAERVQTKDTEV